MSARLDDTVDDQTPASDSVADDLILMSLLLGRFAVRTGNLIEMELRALGDELVRVLTNNDFTETRMESARSQRLKRLLEESELALRSGFGAAGRILLRDTRFGIEVAGDHAAASLNDALGFERARAPDGDRVLGMAGALRVEGKTPTEWWKKLAGDAKFRYGRIIQDGYQRKLSLEDMVRAIRGTGAKLFNDGVLGPSWRAAAALARTAIAAGAALARTFVWADNQDIVGAIQQVSILDLRTCFVAGTPVLMADGTTKSIDQILAGEIVVGGSGVSRSVLATKKAVRTKLIQISLDTGEKIRCTSDHLFRVEDGDVNGKQSWLEAQNLQAGDVLATVLK